jgi:hypothetical protein
MFGDTKGSIRNRKSKTDRQNIDKRKDENMANKDLQHISQKTND